MADRPVLFWFRDDLRLADNPGLAAAHATGKPLVTAYILDEESREVRPPAEPASESIVQRPREYAQPDRQHDPARKRCEQRTGGENQRPRPGLWKLEACGGTADVRHDPVKSSFQTRSHLHVGKLAPLQGLPYHFKPMGRSSAKKRVPKVVPPRKPMAMTRRVSVSKPETRE